MGVALAGHRRPSRTRHCRGRLEEDQFWVRPVRMRGGARQRVAAGQRVLIRLDLPKLERPANAPPCSPSVGRVALEGEAKRLPTRREQFSPGFVKLSHRCRQSCEGLLFYILMVEEAR